MKRLLLSIFLILIIQSLDAQPESSSPARIEWHDKWNHSREYTLEVLRLVPDSSLQFRPTDIQMSFQEQIQHIAGNMFGLSRQYLGYTTKEINDDKLQDWLSAEKLTHQQLEDLINRAYDYADEAVKALPTSADDDIIKNFLAGPISKRGIIYLLQDHATHHRGQLIVYLRLLGLEPPSYRGW